MSAPKMLKDFDSPAEALVFEDLVAQMSAAFVRITVDQMDDEFERWLQRIVLVFGIDRSSIGQLNSFDGLLYTTHQWSREGIAATPASMNAKEVLPWLADKILAGELVVLSNLGDAPPEAAKDLENAGRDGTKSNVTVPLRVEGFVIGGMAFDSVRSECTWSERTVQRCGLVAEMFSNALERKRTVAEIRRLRNELHQTSRLVMMEEATAALAHQLNQPLGAILSNAQAARRFLAAKVPDLTEVKVVLDDIISDNARAVETIRNVRALFQRGQSRVSPVDPRQVLLDVERILRSDAKGRNIHLRLDLPPSLPTIIADRTQVIDALINLVVNAFDAIVEASAGPRDVVVSAGQREPGRVHVAVRDSGSGIDPSIMPRLFQAFVTSKSDGMGLGLAIARSIIETHGGRLWATQNPDRGATMEFYLPAEAAPVSKV